MLFTKDRDVRTTQHVKNIKTLSEDANRKLLSYMDVERESRITINDSVESGDDVGHRQELLEDFKNAKKRGKRGNK